MLLAVTAVAVGGVRAAETDEAIRNACATDFRAYCTGENPADAVATACLKQNFLSLSRECQSALGTSDQQNDAESSDHDSE